MSSLSKMATDFRQKSSEQASDTEQLLKQEFDRLGTCVSEALSLSGQKISDDIAARNRELSGQVMRLSQQVVHEQHQKELTKEREYPGPSLEL